VHRWIDVDHMRRTRVMVIPAVIVKLPDSSLYGDSRKEVRTASIAVAPPLL